MARSSIVQSNFLGGEWSKFAQGRFDDPEYKKAMGLSLNGFPLQEGAWTRRGGWLRCGYTTLGAPGIIRPFVLPNNAPIYLEMTFRDGSSNLSFWHANPAIDPAVFAPLVDDTRSITAISTDNPAKVTVSATEGWTTGTTVVIALDPATGISAASGLGNNRTFAITVIDTENFTIRDAVTGIAVDGSTLSYVNGAGDTASRVLQIGLPYTTLADLQGVRVVKADNLAILLAAGYAPVQLYWNGSTFVLTTADVSTWDGPYLDALEGTGLSQQGVSSGHVDSWLSATTFTIDDGSYTFVAADVGKTLRLWEQPPLWDAGTDYLTSGTAGDRYVTYAGAFWHLSEASAHDMPVGTAPGTTYSFSAGSQTFFNVPWQPAPFAGNWNIAKITSVSGASCGITLSGPIVYPSDGTYLTADIWQIGLYGTGTYPTCGTYHEGRLALGGAQTNRFDMSVATALDSNKVAIVGGIVPPNAFSPTDRQNNVGDGNAIAAICNDTEENDILWLVPHARGISAGTPGGEFLIEASALNDPLTPSSVQAHKVTVYKGSSAEPRRVGFVLLFIQAFGRRLLEYFADAFTAKLSARHVNEFAGHLAQPGLAEIWYQEERTPILWARRNDGILIGCTYRRLSSFSTQPPEFTAWHQHEHGFGNTIESICVGPTPDSTLDCLMAITEDPISHFCDVSMMTSIFEEDYLLPQAMHLEGMMTVGVDTPDAPPAPPTPGAAGKYYFEITVNSVGSGRQRPQFGVGNAAMALVPGVDPLDLTFTGMVGQDNNAAVFGTGPDCTALICGTNLTWAGDPLTNGDVIGIAVDTVNHLLWAKNVTQNSNWNEDSTNGPATGLDGYDISSIVGDLYIVFSGRGPQAVAATLNAGATSFAGTLPTGFSAWDAADTTIWNSADSGVLVATGDVESVALSAGDLKATLSTVGSTNNWVGSKTWFAGQIVFYGTMFWRAQSTIFAPSSAPNLVALWREQGVAVRTNTSKVMA